LHDLKSLKRLDCRSNPSLSQPEIQRFLITNRRCWWSSLDEQWKTIFQDAIEIESEPTKDELVTILSLTELNCSGWELTHLEPLRALTGLQKLDCQRNQLTSLEPLHGLKNLKKLVCKNNSSLTQTEIERFQKAVPSCQVEILEAPSEL